MQGNHIDILADEWEIRHRCCRGFREELWYLAWEGRTCSKSHHPSHHPRLPDSISQDLYVPSIIFALLETGADIAQQLWAQRNPAELVAWAAIGLPWANSARSIRSEEWIQRIRYQKSVALISQVAANFNVRCTKPRRRWRCLGGSWKGGSRSRDFIGTRVSSSNPKPQPRPFHHATTQYELQRW